MFEKLFNSKIENIEKLLGDMNEETYYLGELIEEEIKKIPLAFDNYSLTHN